MKIVNKTEDKKLSPENMYRVGNVIKEFDKIYLVVSNNNDNDKYMLICLTDNSIVGDLEDSLKELVKRYYTWNDELVNAELVIK